MKKLLFLLGGVVTLTACSEDAYQSAEEQNTQDGSQYQTNSFNNDHPGHYFPGYGGDPGRNYFSPWDIRYRTDVIPTYTFMTDGESNTLFELHLTPYIGLAYYDGTNDGHYHDPYLASINPPSLIADLTNGNYPNLYQNHNEIGELIPAAPIVLDGSTLEHSEVSISSYADHCPVNPHTPGSSPGWNPEDRYFDISDTATAQEQDLLSKYGKVFFYEYKVILKSNGSIVGQGYLQVKNQTIQDPGAFHYWDDTFIANAYVPGKGYGGKLFYYHERNLLPGQWPFTEYFHNGVFPDVWCDSREVDYQFEYPNEESLIGSPLHKINLDMAAGVGLWMTSGHHISIRN